MGLGHRPTSEQLRRVAHYNSPVLLDRRACATFGVASFVISSVGERDDLIPGATWNQFSQRAGLPRYLYDFALLLLLCTGEREISPRASICH